MIEVSLRFFEALKATMLSDSPNAAVSIVLDDAGITLKWLEVFPSTNVEYTSCVSLTSIHESRYPHSMLTSLALVGSSVFRAKCNELLLTTMASNPNSNTRVNYLRPVD